VDTGLVGLIFNGTRLPGRVVAEPDSAGRNAEVTASHCGMAMNAEVCGVIATELARLDRGPAVNAACGTRQETDAHTWEGSEQGALAAAGA